ncbi:hypothetical protein GOV04_03400 [Candidatus Woesearchaeota archaeon]|nr:hypothetical protein [Candidatus Woesearchaeota archaeon]
MNFECVACKGRGYCGRVNCPLQAKLHAQQKIKLTTKKDFFGQAPNIFVGRHGYPNVNVGLLSTEQYNNHDNPLLWSKENYNIDTIIDLRSQLVNSNFQANIKSFKDKFTELSQLVAMAKKPAEIEINLQKPPTFTVSLNQEATPHGPSVKLEKAKLTENPKIPTKVEKIVSDTDHKASRALTDLYNKDVDEHYLTKLLSAGTLGVKTDRRLVPTRWSITAVDDTISKKQIERINDNKFSEHTAYFGGHLGNYFLILQFPDVFSYELFEMLTTSKEYTTDYESPYGRKNYAQNTAGGYYAARLAILEGLQKQKSTASVLALRFITSDYWAPLGVWVVREAVRKAMSSKPIIFSDKALMFEYAKKIAKKHFNYKLKTIIEKSQLLKNQREQKKLFNYS